jgi:hypothetical protein
MIFSGAGNVYAGEIIVENVVFFGLLAISSRGKLLGNGQPLY